MTVDLVAMIGELTREIVATDHELDSDTRLFGKEGLLDSIGLVSLVVAVEQEIEDRHSVSVALADERALSLTKSPYRTIGTLAEYASNLMEATE